MTEVDDFLKQNAEQLSREVDRILIRKVRKIIAVVEDELAGKAVPKVDEAPNDKQQLWRDLKTLVEGNEFGFPVDIETMREEFEKRGYRLELEHPPFHDYLQKEFLDGVGSSFRVVIPERDFKVRLYKLQYEA